MTSISPAFTTKKGTFVWPLSINTSPRVMGRITPWQAIRAICAAVSVGNISDALAALVSGVEREASVMMLRSSIHSGVLGGSRSCEPLEELERLLRDLSPTGV